MALSSRMPELSAFEAFLAVAKAGSLGAWQPWDRSGCSGSIYREQWMSTSRNLGSIEDSAIAPLAKIVERNQVWSRMAAKYGVDNPAPPWKTSLDGICDALDQSACGPGILNFVDRRNEEDALSATVYSNLPYPENRLVALAHSLVMRGVSGEAELEERLAAVRARLEA
jgi:hypothetical protein